MSALPNDNVLARILARKVEEVAARSARLPRAELAARLADAPPLATAAVGAATAAIGPPLMRQTSRAAQRRDRQRA